MIQIADRMYIGNKIDFLNNHNRENVYVVNLSHRQHKKLLGYTPQPSDEGYVYIIKDNCFSCNFIDSEDMKYFDYKESGKIVFELLFKYISVHLINPQNKVFICCDRGVSRSVAVALYYKLFILEQSTISFDEFIEETKKIGNPKAGILGILHKIKSSN